MKDEIKIYAQPAIKPVGYYKKILTVEFKGKTYSAFFDIGSLRNLRKIKKKLFKLIELETGNRIRE